MEDFKQFDVQYGVHEYLIEFDLDSVMQCQSAGVLSLMDKPIDFTRMIFYYGAQKHHADRSRGTVNKFFDDYIKDPAEGGLDAFSEITDEFNRIFQLFMAGAKKEKKERKVFKAKNSKVAVTATGK